MSTQHVRVKFIATLAGVALLLAGCSSSGDEDVLAPLESSATSAESSTTTTEATTTTEPTTTTTEPTTTVQPELDPANWNSDLDEIFGRYLLFWQAYDAAYAPPEANPDYPPLAELAGEEALADFRSDIEQNYASAGHVLVIAEDSIEEHVLRLPRPVDLDKTEGNEVIIQDCWVADRTKETLDGEVLETWSFPTVFNATMRVIDGEWRVFANVTAADGSDGWEECNSYFADLDQ